MSRSLLLLRHAEARAAGAGSADFDRILTPRGRDQAREAARRIIAANLHPGVLLASPAARTRETAEIVALALGPGPRSRPGRVARMLLPPALYLADVPVLLSALQGCDDAVQTLLLVGHNPGISALARELAAALPRGSHDAALEPGPALELGLAALCYLTVETPSWHALGAAAVSAIELI